MLPAWSSLLRRARVAGAPVRRLVGGRLRLRVARGGGLAAAGQRDRAHRRVHRLALEVAVWGREGKIKGHS